MQQLGLPMDGIPNADAPSPPERQIGFTHGSLRLRALEKEHERLLRKVESLRAAYDRLEQDLRAARTRMAADMQPIVEETLALDGELHALFRELLADPKRGKRAKRVVRDVYEMLQGGAITPAPDAAPDGTPGSTGDEEPFSDNFGEVPGRAILGRPLDRVKDGVTHDLHLGGGLRRSARHPVSRV
jgi:hypothetical protein